MTTKRDNRHISPSLPKKGESIDNTIQYNKINYNNTLSLLRERGKKDLYFLSKYILGYSKLTKTFHKPLCEFLRRDYRRDKLILAFRGSFKTSVVTISETIQDILIDPNIRVLILCKTIDNAKAIVKAIKEHFLNENSLLRVIYPEHCPSFEKGKIKQEDRGTALYWTTPARTNYALKEPTITAASIMTSLASRHYDKIVFDDIIDEKSAASIADLNLVSERYRYALNLLEPHGWLRVVGTRYDFRDIYGELLKEERWEKFIKPVMDENGNPTCPEIYDKKKIEEKRAAMGEYIFACQFMLVPTHDETKPFKSEWIRWRKELPKDKNYHFFIGIDLAWSHNDKTAFVVIAVDENYDVYVVDSKEGHFDLYGIWERLVDLYLRYQPVLVGFERNGYQGAFGQYLEEKQKEKGIKLPVVSIHHKTDKYRRIVSTIQPFLQANVLSNRKRLFLLPRGDNEKLAEYFEYYDKCPDDMLDALVIALEIAYLPEPYTQTQKPWTLGWLKNQHKKLGRRKLLDRWEDL